MEVTVKKIKLWRGTIENRAGVLAHTLDPFSAAGTDIQVLMAYRIPGDHAKAAVEVYPIEAGDAALARRAGLAPADIPSLLVTGDNAPGLGAEISRAIASRGINISFLVMQVLEKRYTGVFGFDSENDAKAAALIIRRASASPRRRPAPSAPAAAPAKKAGARR